MIEARVGSGGRTLAFSTDSGGRTRDTVTATVEGAGLSAAAKIYDIRRHFGLIEYFNGLELDWRGWAGARRYQSIESDLVLTARHHRVVMLQVELHGGHVEHSWSAQATVEVDPGEELSTFADSLRGLFE